MKRQLFCLLLGSVVFLFPSAAFAGWTQAEGEGYVKAWSAFLAGSRAFDTTGELIEVQPFRVAHANVYVEYGLTEDWTAVGHARPVGWSRYGDATSWYSGPVEAGLRRSLRKGTLPLALEMRLGATLPSPEGNLAGPEEEVVFLASWPGARASLELQLGYSFGTSWLRAGTGIRLNLGDHTEGFAALQVGTVFGERFIAAAHLGLNHTFEPLPQTNVTGEGPTSYLGFGLSLGWWFAPRWGVSLGADGAFFARSNAGSLVPQLGLEHRF